MKKSIFIFLAAALSSCFILSCPRDFNNPYDPGSTIAFVELKIVEPATTVDCFADTSSTCKFDVRGTFTGELVENGFGVYVLVNPLNPNRYFVYKANIEPNKKEWSGKVQVGDAANRASDGQPFRLLAVATKDTNTIRSLAFVDSLKQLPSHQIESPMVNLKLVRSVEVTLINDTDKDCPRPGLAINKGYNIIVDVKPGTQSIVVPAGQSVKTKLPVGGYSFISRCEDRTRIDSLSAAISIQKNTVIFNGHCNYCIPKPDGLMIDDFDNGDKINLLGFADGEFRLPPDNREILNITHISHTDQPENVLRGTGGSIKIEFNFRNAPPNAFWFCGWLTTLNDTLSSARGKGFNLANLNFRYLTFWVKADAPRTSFELAFKDNTRRCEGDGCQTYPKEIPSADVFWKKMRVPLSALFRNHKGAEVDSTCLREINVAFTNGMEPLSGVIYLDEIAFER